MKAWVFGGMLVLSAALAACSSSGTDGAGGGSGGGSGEGGGGDGGSGQATTGTGTTGTTTPATTSTTTTSSTGGGTCLGEAFLEDPTCDACVQESCCAEIEACIADFQNGGTDCVNADGSFNPDGTLSNAFFTCADNNCSAECGGGGGGICGTPLGYQDQEVNDCIEGSCCDEFVACVGEDGSTGDACNACLEAGGGALCDGFLACTDEQGCFGFQVCDSILLVTDGDLAECLGTNCCDETNACFGEDEASFDACIACLEGGGGALCDGLIACDTESACGLLTEG